MPRRPPLACLLVALLLTGCSAGPNASDRPVKVSPPVGAASLLPGCVMLHGDLPSTLPQGLARRPTTPLSKQTAAWGLPPIVLRCGVPQGKDTDELFTFNGVEWAVHDIGSSRRWTTRGLRVDVEVVVPDHYSSQAELLGSLSRVLLNDLGR